LPLRLAILTISDAGSRGERSDSSGDLIASWVKGRGYTMAERALVPDETGRIAALLAEWADGGRADVILTTGIGTNGSRGAEHGPERTNPNRIASACDPNGRIRNPIGPSRNPNGRIRKRIAPSRDPNRRIRTRSRRHEAAA
jgi:hypothetical protein